VDHGVPALKIKAALTVPTKSTKKSTTTTTTTGTN
jgi:hypothetical protein